MTEELYKPEGSSLQDGTASLAGQAAKWFDRGSKNRGGRNGGRERGEKKQSKYRKGSRAGLCSPTPFNLRKQREKRWSEKWHRVHPNDERWIAAQRGGEERTSPVGDYCMLEDMESCSVIANTHTHTDFAELLWKPPISAANVTSLIHTTNAPISPNNSVSYQATGQGHPAEKLWGKNGGEGHSQANLDKWLVHTTLRHSQRTVAKTTANKFSSQLWRSLPLQLGQTQRELHC